MEKNPDISRPIDGSIKRLLMDSIMLKVYHIIGRVNEWVGNKTAWLTTALVLLVGLDVLYRRALNDTQTWIMEMEWHLFALIFLLAAGYAFKHDRHVRVDLFYSKFSEKDKARVNLIGGLLFLLPWCAILIHFALKFSWDAFLIRETSPDPGGLPARYLIKFAIALGAFFLLLQGIASILESILTLRNTRPASEDEQTPESI